MRAYSSMPIQDFTAQLRDIAIKAGARPLVMDMIAELDTRPTDEEIANDLSDAEEAAEAQGASAMWEQCFDAVDDYFGGVDSPVEFTHEQQQAIKTILTGLKPCM